MDMQTPAARHLMLGATCCWRPPAVSGRLERPGISWQKTIGVQRYYFDGNNKRHLYPCAASIVEVVERGSFTAAARELNLTQPAVTHQVQELERRFNVDLVERFGKRAYLTQAGEKLLAHARQLLEDDARAQMEMRRFDGGWLGRVRIGTSATVLMYALPPILRRLKTEHPQLEINLKAGLTATT